MSSMGNFCILSMLCLAASLHANVSAAAKSSSLGRNAPQRDRVALASAAVARERGELRQKMEKYHDVLCQACGCRTGRERAALRRRRRGGPDYRPARA